MVELIISLMFSLTRKLPSPLPCLLPPRMYCPPAQARLHETTPPAVGGDPRPHLTECSGCQDVQGGSHQQLPVQAGEQAGFTGLEQTVEKPQGLSGIHCKAKGGVGRKNCSLGSSVSRGADPRRAPRPDLRAGPRPDPRPKIYGPLGP